MTPNDIHQLHSNPAIEDANCEQIVSEFSAVELCRLITFTLSHIFIFLPYTRICGFTLIISFVSIDV